MFKKGKVLIGFVAIILCSLLLTGCGKSKIEKFKEYLVEEAGYEEKNVDYFILKKDGYLYSIGLSGSFTRQSLTNTDKFSMHKVYYDFEFNKGRAEYLVDINRCEYDFVLDESIPQNRNLYNCPDQEKFNKEMFALKEMFDGYLKAAGIKRLDLFKSKTEQ